MAFLVLGGTQIMTRFDFGRTVCVAEKDFLTPLFLKLIPLSSLTHLVLEELSVWRVAGGFFDSSFLKINSSLTPTAIRTTFPRYVSRLLCDCKAINKPFDDIELPKERR